MRKLLASLLFLCSLASATPDGPRYYFLAMVMRGYRSWISTRLTLVLVLLCLMAYGGPAFSANLLSESFSSGIGAFDNGSQTSGEGPDFEDGYLTLSSNTTSTASFTAYSQSSGGDVRFDFWWRDDSTTTAAGTTATSFIYLLPTSGSVSSANSIATVAIDRNSTRGFSATAVGITGRIGASFQDFVTARRDNRTWWKVSVVARTSSRQIDYYVNDVLWMSGASPNASYSDIQRVALLNQAGSPAMLFDEISVESEWSLTESVLIDHTFIGGSGEIEDSTPTDNRNIYPQPWLIPEDSSSFGGYTLGANGAQADSGLDSLAMSRTVSEGVFEAQFFTTSSGTASDMYFGLMLRVWAGLDSDSYLLFRYWKGSSNRFSLFQGSTSLAGSGTSPDLVADTTYTIKVVARGRYLWCYYKQAEMDAGSYTLLFGGPHLVEDNASGARGMLSEENSGPFVANSFTSVTDNYVQRFRVTGATPETELNLTVGDNQLNLSTGQVREMYRTDSGMPERNLGWSKFIQAGHRAEGDMGNYALAQSRLIDSTNVQQVRQRSLNVMEDGVTGNSEVWWTITDRGIWVGDKTYTFGTAVNIAPDMDFRPELWSDSYKVVGPTGSPTDKTNSGFHTWRNDIANSSLPLSLQRLTSLSGADVRVSGVVNNTTGLSGSVFNITAKFLGNGDPRSNAVDIQAANVVDGSTYEWHRAYLVETESALSDAVLTGWRDDVSHPATISSPTRGSLVTDAPGDLNADGFTERYGWYEIEMDANDQAEWSFPASTYDRYYPQFRLSSWGGADQVSIGGSVASVGTDYLIDDLGDGTALLQLLDVLTSDTEIVIDGANPAQAIVRSTDLFHSHIFSSRVIR